MVFGHCPVELFEIINLNVLSSSSISQRLIATFLYFLEKKVVVCEFYERGKKVASKFPTSRCFKNLDIINNGKFIILNY